MRAQQQLTVDVPAGGDAWAEAFVQVSRSPAGPARAGKAPSTPSAGLCPSPAKRAPRRRSCHGGAAGDTPRAKPAARDAAGGAALVDSARPASGDAGAATLSLACDDAGAAWQHDQAVVVPHTPPAAAPAAVVAAAPAAAGAAVAARPCASPFASHEAQAPRRSRRAAAARAFKAVGRTLWQGIQAVHAAPAAATPGAGGAWLAPRRAG
ncbi:hypothetical protein HT031_002294 [Scenedesmus sp. PABB004]|nr:hypothetical protein HT031_002294 [Scenedesmus sp. PABB004]